MFERDVIFAEPRASITKFTFDEAVAHVFPDMLKRSIPGYTQIVSYLGLWAAAHAQANTNVYDLGCSLGAATFAMREQIKQPNVQFVAVDNAPAMLAKFADLLRTTHRGDRQIELVLSDLQDVPIENASIVVLNFTLQFIDPAERDAIIGRIYEGLNPNGILILSEKVVFPSHEQTERFIDVYHDFKRANGYSALEVAQKRTALENVLIPETIESYQTRLLSAGFASAEVWFQAFNFMSIVAIKRG